MKEQFNQIIKSENLKDITIDLVEKVLDDNIGNDVIKEIPILKSLVTARNIYNSYTDRIFIKKAMNVLLELGDTNWKERIELTYDLEDNDSNGSEKILMTIDNLQTIEKCKIFGRLCKLKALGEIDLFEFKRLTKLIQDAYINDLELLPNFSERLKKEKKSYEGNNIYMEEFYPLMSLELIYQEQSEQTPIEKVEPMSYKDPAPYYKGGEIETLFYISDLGRLLLSFYFELIPNKKE
ncbi:hypothetical protein ACJOV8_009390 [Formosa sp. 3Alg 14/1]|uniref:hypothetical protein n=1 Tax=Formosa sp. 3Alg 14/1 TaxID=3382190 RepID=UPI0039BE9506